MASEESLSTDHLYYEDTSLFTCEAKILQQVEVEGKGGKELCLILDRTVMHPQGGTWDHVAMTGCVHPQEGVCLVEPC